MVEPVSTDLTKPVRMYYAAAPDGGVAANQRAQTNSRFGVGNLIEKIKVVEDIEWKLDLHEYTTLKKKWTREAEAWTENSARVYNLVLRHCPPELEAELQNHSKWNRSDHNCIDLLLMIRDVTHNMKETKQ